MRKLGLLAVVVFFLAVLAPHAVARPPRAGRDASAIALGKATHARTKSRLGKPAVSPSIISGYTPSQIRTAYGFDKLTADGSGQIIALVEAFGSPTIVSDFSTFCTQFSLPQTSSTLTIVYPSGTPTTSDAGWAFETSLDVEWAHAIAPQAEILLVISATDDIDALFNAVDYANKYVDGSGKTVHQVSMSWGGSEFNGETAYDTYLQTPGINHFVSSGDEGAGAEYPSTSPYVVSVGGTSLTLDPTTSAIIKEVSWSDSSGGPSAYETVPSFQTGIPITGFRQTPDVAYSGDPSNGFAVYDSTPYNGQSGWLEAGGTSAGAPQWAALMALVNGLRPSASSGIVDTPIYGLAASSVGTYLRDITSGSNGTYHAKSGYDEVTGLGSPIAQQLIPALVSQAATFSVSVTAAGDTGTGTLRAALAEARAGDTLQITFDPGLAGKTIVLATSDAASTGSTPAAPFGNSALVIDGVNVTIDATAAPGLTLSGNNGQRIFVVTGGASAAGNGTGSPAAAAGSLTLVNVTLSGGHAHGWNGGLGVTSGGGGSAGPGGAVLVDSGSTLVLEGCLLTASTAQGGSGSGLGGVATSGGGGGLSGDGFGSEGGPPNDPASAAPGFGGGGTSGFASGAGGFGGGGASSVSATSAGGAGGFGGGGGGGDAGDAAGAGGFGGGSGSLLGLGGGGAGLGGAVFVNGGSLTATNCTFANCQALSGTSAGNAGSGLGGAIFQRNGSVGLNFCTLANNTASTDGGALSVLGDAATATVSVHSSILSGSVTAAHDGNGATINAGVLAVTGDHNVVVTQSGLSLTTVSSVDPNLGPLESNGGPTASFVLYGGSSAHDAGDGVLAAKTLANGGAAGVDQRGLPRRSVTDVGATETQPCTVAVVSGGGQDEPILTAFAAIGLLVSDDNGDALQAATIKIASPTTGASATFTATTLTSNASGHATVNATANATAGTYAVAAIGSISGSFALTNDAGPFATLGLVSGGGQSARASQPFADLIVLLASDAHGNPVSGTVVTVTPPATGASATFGGGLTSHASGLISLTATANATAGGPYSVTVASGAVSTSFQLTNDGPPTTMVVSSGSGQTTTVGNTFSSAIVLFVTDTNGNGVGGVTLTLTPPTSGASATFSPSSPATDSTGHVSVTATANGSSGGPYTVEVAAGSLTTSFQLTNQAASSGGGGSTPTPSPSPTPAPSPSPTPAPSPSPTPVTTGSSGSSSNTGGGGGGGGGGGCTLAATSQSPASLAPLALAVMGLVLVRTRRGVRS